jgi:two-component system, cell cycle sensor histidine kinase and response regulator CckA
MQDNEALLRLKQLLKETQALARVGSFEWDIQTGAVTWSEQLFEIFGVDPQSFVPSFEAYLSMVVPQQRTAVMRSIYTAIESCSHFESVETILRPDGSRRVISSRGRVISPNKLNHCRNYKPARTVIAL